MNLILGTSSPYIDLRHQQRRLPRALHSLHRRAVDHAGGLRADLLFPAGQRANPIYSHKLSLVGFWSLALFYPFVGIHHYLYSPIADWAETLAIITSMLLIIPVWTVLQNFFGTMIGRWQRLRQEPAGEIPDHGLDHVSDRLLSRARPRRCARSSSRPTSPISSSRHSHLTVFGTFVVWAMGGLVYVWPQLLRPRTLVVQAGQLVVLADHARHLTMGSGPDRRGLSRAYMWMAGRSG